MKKHEERKVQLVEGEITACFASVDEGRSVGFSRASALGVFMVMSLADVATVRKMLDRAELFLSKQHGWEEPK